MTKMRIAILTPVIPPYVGGIGKAALAEAEMLARDFDVTIFTPRYKHIKKNEEQRGKVKIKYIKPFFAFGNAAILAGLKKELEDFNIVYLHYPFFGTAEFLTYNLQSTTHNLVMRYHMDVVGRGWFRLFFWFHTKLIMPQILKKAEKIIVSSFDYARNSNTKDLFKKCPEKFAEIPFGVDIEKFKLAPKDQELLKRHGLDPNAKILLFVGGLDRAHYFKGLDFLLRAIKSLGYKLQATSYKLVIVGDGDLRPYYENLAKRFGIFGHVRFVGKVISDDLPRYYNLADIFIFPSIDRSEAFGIALLEALACGKPAIVSDIPGVRTLIHDQKNGFLVTPQDHRAIAEKISQILCQDNEMGKASRKLVEYHYANALVSAQLLDLFRTIC